MIDNWDLTQLFFFAGMLAGFLLFWACDVAHITKGDDK